MPSATDKQWILLFVAIEHVFLFIRVLIDVLIPDVSSEVKFSIDRDQFALRSKKNL